MEKEQTNLAASPEATTSNTAKATPLLSDAMVRIMAATVEVPNRESPYREAMTEETKALLTAGNNMAAQQRRVARMRFNLSMGRATQRSHKK
jgi:hypothetical protein